MRADGTEPQEISTTHHSKRKAVHMQGVILSLILFLLTAVVTAGCQKGRFTEDRRYIGHPERPAATSEPIQPRNEESRPAHHEPDVAR